MFGGDALKVLEFEKILSVISEGALSGASRKAVLEIRPMAGKEDINRISGAIKEIMRMSIEGSPLMISAFPEVKEAISGARPEDAVLEPGELLNIAAVLDVIGRVSSQISGRKDARFLKELVHGMNGYPEIASRIWRTVDSDGNVLDGASSVLRDLRARTRALDAKIRRALEEIAGDRRVAPFLQDGFITKRSGRWVIPVRMDSKGQIDGVVHDVSRTGDTAFVEPLGTIGPSNELENLFADSRAEEIRILRAVSSMVRARAGEMEADYERLVRLDVLNSISKFSLGFGLEFPEMNDSSRIGLIGARHPLLMLTKGGREDVVPLDISLGPEEKVMVVTGPNAGGKTVAIKTVGLLLLMAHSGMPVAASAASTVPVVEEILVDIGDEQSIEDSLSTFSAHMTKISGIVGKAGPKSIVLLDELGTGTEPVQGAAISCAVLEALREKGAISLATTHLTEIAGFVERAGGMVNASMDFDQETLTPLYRLTMGEPGQSHSLEIAGRCGLAEDVLKRARNLVGNVKAEFEGLVSDMKKTRRMYEEAALALKWRLKDLDEKERVLKQSLAEIEAGRKEAAKRALIEAREMVFDAKRRINAMLDEAKKGKGRAALKSLDKERAKIEEGLSGLENARPLTPEEISSGDTVFVRSLGFDLKVLRVDSKNKRLRVEAGRGEAEVPLSDAFPKRGLLPSAEKTGAGADSAPEAPLSTLNLIGMKVDEAVGLLEPFLNHASLALLKEVYVVHGFGTGALRRAVRGLMEGHPLVEGFRDAEPSRGGGGVTVVALK